MSNPYASQPVCEMIIREYAAEDDRREEDKEDKEDKEKQGEGKE